RGRVERTLNLPGDAIQPLEGAAVLHLDGLWLVDGLESQALALQDDVRPKLVQPVGEAEGISDDPVELVQVLRVALGATRGEAVECPLEAQQPLDRTAQSR